MDQEMAMSAKQHHTSIAFLVLITKLCHHAGISHDEKRYIEVTTHHPQISDAKRVRTHEKRKTIGHKL